MYQIACGGGGAVRHATYLINRIATRSLIGHTPYKDFRNKRPNLRHLKIFDCVCYARTKVAGKKNLGDRSKVLVYLGTEPSTKAYRLLYPSSKKIIVSPDVHFDEEKQWSWTTNESEKGNNSSSFEIELVFNEH